MMHAFTHLKIYPNLTFGGKTKNVLLINFMSNANLFNLNPLKIATTLTISYNNSRHMHANTTNMDHWITWKQG